MNFENTGTMDSNAANPLSLKDIKSAGLKLKSNFDSKTQKYKRTFYDIVFLVGFLCCLVPGPLPSLTAPASMLLVLCIMISFFDENFFMYSMLFVYMRYIMMITDGTPAYRIYSYLVVIKFGMDFFKTKVKLTALPALFVFFLHSIFAVPTIDSLRMGLNVIVDCVLIYIIVLKITSDDRLMSKFILAFLIGGVTSGVYGWTSSDVSITFNVSGAGAQTIDRNFGALNDANYAGFIYSLLVMCTFVLKDIPKWLRIAFLLIFATMLAQTVSLSAHITLSVMAAFYIILKYRGKSAFILFFAFFGVVILLTVLLSVPQFREIKVIAGFLIRIQEKLSYIPRGRWDLLTTDRYAIWQKVLAYHGKKSIWGKLIGGSVITVAVRDDSVSTMACHNSFVQSILNFGIIGTVMIYLPLFTTFCYRLYKHFSQKPKYKSEDLKCIQLLFMFSFLVFGMTVDFFVDWPYMMFYFI